MNNTNLSPSILFLTYLLFVGNIVWGQVTISTQDFESSPATPTLTFTNTNGVNSTGTNGAGGNPANANLFVSGARGWQVLNATSTLTFANQSLSGYTDCFVEFRLAGMSVTATNGIDAGDVVTVSISVDGGTTYSSELTIGGSAANQRWDFTAIGTSTITYDGNNSPTAVTSSTGSSGISNVRINIPNSQTQVRLRIAMLNNDANERWVIDDASIKGTVGASCTPPTTQATTFTSANITSSQMDIGWSRGNGDAVLVVARSGSAVNADPTAGTPYTADANFTSGDQIGTGNYVVYAGTGTSVTVTGLTAGITYHYAVYEYFTADNCYNSTQLTGNASTPSNIPQVVINEIYGAGGNSGATYRNDAVILKNLTGNTVNLSSWTLQYQSSGGTGNFTQITSLTGTISANGLYCILLGSSGAIGTTTYPAPCDAPGVTDLGLNISATNGKLALANSSAGVDNPNSSNVADFVGYGSANEFEGAGPASSPSATTSIIRTQETNDNSVDFTTNAAPLPIQIVQFEVIIKFSSTLLSFSTATELNNSHFVIERSAEGRDFSEIGQVRGAGTTRVPQSYTFTDERPLQGLNYYRLRQVDFDGAESFSPVVSVVFGKRTGITLAPSPATDRVRIQLDEAFGNDGLWQVYDNTGRQVLSGAWEAESADYELDVNTLPEGMYTFRLVVGAQVEVKQFRKM